MLFSHDIQGDPDSIGCVLLCFLQMFVKEGTLMKVSKKSRQPRHLFLVSCFIREPFKTPEFVESDSELLLKSSSNITLKIRRKSVSSAKCSIRHSSLISVGCNIPALFLLYTQDIVKSKGCYVSLRRQRHYLDRTEQVDGHEAKLKFSRPVRFFYCHLSQAKKNNILLL